MSEDTSLPSIEPAALSQIAEQILTAIGHPNGAASLATTTPPAMENFLRCTRDQLLGFAKRLGLAGVSKLSKPDLASRLHTVFAKISPGAAGASNGTAPAAAKPKTTTSSSTAEDPSDGGGFPSKYDLGPDAADTQMPRNIPWGYGQDRVTAMVVDPDRLFVYWEVTDDALARTRRELGRGGPDAWLNLRVYDVTGRLFDGTNAHSYFDHKLERHDRQWFFDINKPTSSACVEVGLRSSEGFFVKIARSGRVEFPRKEPLGTGHVEWLTVNTAGGAPDSPVGGGGGGGNSAAAGTPAAVASAPGWEDGSVQAAPPHAGNDDGDGESLHLIATGERHHENRWQWREGVHGEWQHQLAAISWTEPVIRSTWEAGPFTYPVESPVFTEEQQPSGGVLTTRTEGNRVHVTYGPWQVVIRGLGARAERKVLSTWQITHRWSTVVATEKTPVTWRQVGPGSSEWMAEGGSERSWIVGSELRLHGASEVFFLGASETRLQGGSERSFLGASEYRFRGASERVAAGASESRFKGASERSFAGASEGRLGGASEARALGASEQMQAYPTAGAAAAESPSAKSGGRR